MIYRDFGKLGWQVSAMGLGTWNIGNQWGELDDTTSWATVRAAYDAGVNLFDVAESYGIPNGLSEERLGTALKGIRHNSIVISKIGHWGKRTGAGVPKTTVDLIRLCAHASLGRMRTDYIDVELCHEGNIEDPSIYLEAFEMLKTRGYIRAYGISTDSLDVLKCFNANGTCSVVEVNYSLVNRASEAELLPYCKKNGIAVLVRGPLSRGLLAGKYSADTVFTDNVRSSWNKPGPQRDNFLGRLAKVDKLRDKFAPGQEMVEAALKYVASHPAMPVAIPGAKSAEQAAMNAHAGDKLFTAEEFAELQALTD